jgi:hypothetical protein
MDDLVPGRCNSGDSGAVIHIPMTATPHGPAPAYTWATATIAAPTRQAARLCTIHSTTTTAL